MTRRLEGWTPTDPPSAAKLNALRDAIEADGQGLDGLRETVVALLNLIDGNAWTTPLQFQVLTVGADRMTCVPGAGTPAGGERAFDAFPDPILLEASRGGVTYTYTDINTRQATDGAETEDQVLIPAYAIGDLLYLEIWPDGTYVDAGTANRAWAALGLVLGPAFTS